MANGLKFSPRKTALALAVAVVCAWQSPVFAHGSEAHMVPLDKTLQEFGAWLQAEGLQAIATRVSTGGECKIIIEDGRVAEYAEPAPTAQPAAPSFLGGLF